MQATPTGGQYHLRLAGANGTVEAIITEVAAGIRELRVGGAALTEPFPARQTPAGACGIVLMPWPNRVADGRWTLDGETQQLDITEPKSGNAIHGLLRYSPYRVATQTESVLVQEATVFPQHGWPFVLETLVRHELVDDGIRVTHEVVNRSGRPAPFAVGNHPYLRVGDAPIEDCVVTLPASTAFTTDSKSIPTGTTTVAGTPLDLRQGVRVADADLDTGYTDIAADGEGVRRAHLRGPQGDATELWMDDQFRFAQVFTSRIFPKYDADGQPVGKRLALAVEPMTAPANALNSGTGLRWLDPDEQWTGSWGIRRIAS